MENKVPSTVPFGKGGDVETVSCYICGKVDSEKQILRWLWDNWITYFCSQDCKDTYFNPSASPTLLKGKLHYHDTRRTERD